MQYFGIMLESVWKYHLFEVWNSIELIANEWNTNKIERTFVGLITIREVNSTLQFFM